MENTHPDIESRTNYWQEFYKTHPDLGPLESIVATHPGLVKIFNFCFVSSIWENIRQYPFDDKIAELKTISQKDKEYLSDKHMEPGPNQEWLDYLDHLLQVVTATVKLKEKLDSENVELGGKYSQGDIIKIVESEFHNRISVDETVVFKEKDGVQKVVMGTGRFWPVCFRVAITTFNRNLGTTEEVYQEHYEYPPTKEDIIATWDDLDRYSVTSFQKYKGLMDNICFDSASNSYVVELYYESKKLDAEFTFSILKRYDPLAQITVKTILKTFPSYFRIENELNTVTLTADGFDQKFIDERKAQLRKMLKQTDIFLVQANVRKKLYELALRYDESQPVGPRGYFKKSLEHFPSEFYESLTSECGKVFCDEDCRKRRMYENKDYCEHETPEGYCGNPKYKRRWKTELYAKIDHSEGSVDDFKKINENQNNHVRRLDTIVAPETDNYRDDEKYGTIDYKLLIEEALRAAKPMERQIYIEHRFKGKKQQELSLKYGISQSAVSKIVCKIENIAKGIKKRKLTE